MGVAILAGFLFATGASGGYPADKQFHADALKIDDRYTQEIQFTALGVRVPLRRNAYVRVDGPVADTVEQVRLLLRELGVTGTNTTYSNPATQGGQVHLRFRDGRESSFIWAVRNADSRVTRASLEHEKYHAICRMAPEAIRSLSIKITQLGFRLDLSDHDEEVAATVIEVLTLHLEGAPLDEIHGVDLLEKAVQLVRDSEDEPDRMEASAPSYDSRLSVQWPQGRDVIEIPLEFLDDIPVVRCQLNGRLAILYVATTSQPILLYTDRLARLGVNAGGQVESPRYAAPGRLERTSFTGGFLLTFKDGLGIEVSGAPCVPDGGRDQNHDVDGLLGVKIMRALNGVIDLGASNMTFTVKAAPKSGPANSSPPIGSETNRTSSPAGSRR